MRPGDETRAEEVWKKIKLGRYVVRGAWIGGGGVRLWGCNFSLLIISTRFSIVRQMMC